MAARPTWKGYLKISLVNIPVQVFPATDSAATISFNQLHAECQTRIQQKRWCPHCEREVPNTELVKGYEFEKGRYVVDRPRRTSRRCGPSRRASSTSCSSPTRRRSIRSTSSGRTTWRPTAPMATEAFAVMREGMEGKAGIGKVALYGREYLVAVQPQREGARDVHAAAREGDPQHGRDRRARDGAGEGQAGRDEAGEAGDRQLRGRAEPRRSTGTSTRRSCSGSSTRRSPARRSSRPRRRRRPRSST